MADDRNRERSGYGRDPQSNPGTGNINPSAPTTGTEGYGIGRGEGGNLAGNNPSATHPGKEGGGNLRESREEMRNDSAGGAPDRREAGSANPQGDRTFRCADVGFTDCRFEAAGRSNEDLLPQIERHGREAHGITSIDDRMRRRILDAIHDRRAA